MWKSSIMFTAAALMVPSMGCDIDVNDPGQLPDIEIRNGRMPDVKVRGPEVEVREQSKEVEVPTDIDVKTETKTITVPEVDVTFPKENGR
jgi:hypothetical protein